MTEPDPKVTPAEPDDLADKLSFALRHEGRKSQHDSDKLNADIVARRLVRHLDRAGYVVMKKPPLGPMLVKRVLRIDRQTVIAYVAPISMRIVGPFALVTIAAETLQRPEPEGVPIASMRRIVVGDRRRGDAVPREAEGAERLDSKLVVSALSPALQRVPGPPGERLSGIGGERWHRHRPNRETWNSQRSRLS